jgi:serine/threonine protein kinase
VALLAHKLGRVVEAETGPCPWNRSPSSRQRAGRPARRRSLPRPAGSVEDAGLDLVEESADFGGTLAVEAGRGRWRLASDVRTEPGTSKPARRLTDRVAWRSMAPSPLPYRLGARIGFGGYAEVFEATSRAAPETVVAFKRPRTDRVLASARLRREIDVQLRLEHPNVMPILDADPDRKWFVMPLAAGSLKKLWDDGRLGMDASTVALEIIGQVSRGLEYAQSEGFLHRDVSPGNILGYE